jgi:DNA-binding response OmpR family regulator
MQSGAMALIVARPDRLSDGWRALLLATPRIAGVRQAHDTASALKTVQALDPDLVLLDADAFGEMTWALLDQIKAKVLHCCCIALICSVHQRPKALAMGADAVLVKGFSAEQLSAAVERLLAPQERAE